MTLANERCSISNRGKYMNRSPERVVEKSIQYELLLSLLLLHSNEPNPL